MFCCRCDVAQDWIPFPKEWLSQGIIVIDKENCTEDDVLMTFLVIF